MYLTDKHFRTWHTPTVRDPLLGPIEKGDNMRHSKGYVTRELLFGIFLAAGIMVGAALIAPHPAHGATTTRGTAIVSIGSPATGQATMANSLPVVISSNQSSLPVANFPAAVATGTGAQGATVPRVTVATDSATVAGSASLPAGTNVIGKATIDQTTPGTTNLVAAGGPGSAGAAVTGNPLLVGGTDGTNAQFGKVSSAANLNAGATPGSTPVVGAFLFSKPGMWSASNTGVAGTAATVSQSAPGASKFLVLDSFCASFGAGAAGQTTPVTCSAIQDSGGTPLNLISWSGSAVANSSGGGTCVSGLNIPQTVSNKTLSCTCTAVSANTVSSCTISGYTVQ